MPKFDVNSRVQNVRPASEYYGQIGVVVSARRAGSEYRYAVRWPDGDTFDYREGSITAAIIPEKSYETSNSGFRTTGAKKRRVVKHRIPAASRPILA